MDRLKRLLGTADRSQTIVEIGAGYCPVAPKAEGWRTHVVDHASRDDLRRKYATAAEVDVQAIEAVDTIWQGGALHEAMPERLLGQVDIIIASHVLEHMPDLVGFLASASRLVRPGGSLSVALPDRRYCFDCLKPWTTTGDLLDAQYRGLTRHSLKTAFNNMAYSAVVDGQLAWGQYPVNLPTLMDPFQVAAQTVSLFRERETGAYEDYHAWQFTPACFRLAMLELAALGATDWHIETLEGPENFEFFALLRRGSKGVDPASLQAERRDLLIRQLAEAREQIDFILGASDRPVRHTPPADDTYHVLLDKLAEQQATLREMADTLAWLRTVLAPVRRMLRRLRLRQ